MNTTEPIPASVEELLTPVEQSLAACADHGQSVSRACDQLRKAVDALEDAAGDDWSLCGRTLANLLEIVDCFADGPDSLDAGAAEEIVEFVKSSVSSLRESLTGTNGEEHETVLELVEEARSRWGEYLTLVEGDAFYESAALDTELGVDGTPADDWDETGSNPAEQVDLILSAVKELSRGAGTAAESPSPAETETDANQAAASHRSAQREGRGTLPTVPAAPQRIALSEVLREAYLEDAEQCLSSMERSVIAFENDPQGAAPIDQLGRNLHTLKGASASIGLSELATYLHEIEEWLPSYRASGASHGLQPILDCVDFVRTQIETLQHPEKPPESSVAGLPQPNRPFGPSPMMGANGAQPAPKGSQSSGENKSPTPSVPQRPPAPVTSGVDRSADPGEETVRVRSSQLDRMMNLLVDLVIWRRRRDRRVAELNENSEELSRCVRRLETLAKGFSLNRTLPPGALPNGQPSADAESRESTNRLGEITNDLREIAGSLRECRQSMADENRAVSQFIQQFRQQLAQARRVPLSGLFQRLQRVVREAARLEDKQVRLECIGQYTGLERSLQERLYEPLLHLVRNAVCHGIETQENRLRAGKEAVGTITLEATGSSQMLLLEIRDDGAGLDFDAIRRRGIERGLLRPDEPVTPNELSRLIFHPGFSTRTEANEVAGRGVGMDVVLTALNRCHCQIDVHSEAGVGTTFRLVIPLPSVIEHALVFRCGGQLFGLPMQSVMSTSQSDVPSDGDEPVLQQGQLDLSRILRLPQPDALRASRSLVLGNNLQSHASSSNGKKASTSPHPAEHRREFLVENILGPEEVVIRPLPPILRRHPVVSGVTLSGAGEVVLLLDGPRLLKIAAESADSEQPAEERTARSGRTEDIEIKRRRILVAEDSLSARRRLVEKLISYGFEITEASDGAEALNYARSTTFDAVFSDLEMPGLDGFELLTAIKGDPRIPDKPVVIVTSRDEPETRTRARDLGADGFLAKPVSDASIESMLEQLDDNRSTSPRSQTEFGNKADDLTEVTT